VTKARDLASNSTGSKPTLVDAKGDLLVGTAADTAGRLVVGSNGETLVADSSTSTGLRYQGNFAAGKNKFLNADFNIWQRGTSFTISAGSVIYTADRFKMQCGGTGGSVTVSRETFTTGQTDVPNNPTYYLRTTVTTLPTSGTNSDIIQAVEDVRTFAGQTVTFSFYAKASSSRNLECIIGQEFGSGGSGTVYTSLTLSSSTVGTTWARFTGTVTLPSISGKTIGTNNHLSCYIRISNPATGLTWDLSNVQLEAGSVATAFQTATGTLAGELAACQRYYEKTYSIATAPGTDTYEGHQIISGSSDGGNQVYHTPRFQVRKRANPTITTYTNDGISGQWGYNRSGASGNITASVIRISDNGALIYGNVGASYVVTTWAGHWVANAEL